MRKGKKMVERRRYGKTREKEKGVQGAERRESSRRGGFFVIG